MKLKLLSILLLISGLSFGQDSKFIAGKPADEMPVYVSLTPAGADTGLEIRSAMRIAVVHMEEGNLTAYRFQDQAFLMSCPNEAKAKAMMEKLGSKFQDAKVELVETDNYTKIGFAPIQVGAGRTDPTFPKFYVTGDNPLDSRSYRIEKLEWLSEHPIPQEQTSTTPTK